MKQELKKHLNNIERLVQKNYITLEIIKNFYENCDGGFENSQKTLIILRDMIEQQKPVYKIEENKQYNDCFYYKRLY